eukprot:c21963_g1_i1 orf=61-4728(+)
MRCHSVQAVWASTPPAHQVVAMVATHNPPSLWTGGSRGDIIFWKLSSRPPDPDHISQQDLLPMALLCGHTASIVALVACRPNEVKDDGVHTTGLSMVNWDSCAPSFCEVIVSVCVEGWLCAWDYLTRRCRRRRKLPPWLGSPCSMTALIGAQRYVAIACDGCNKGSSRSTTTIEGDNDIRKLVDNARTMAWERSGSTKKDLRVAVIIVDTLTLGVVQVVYNGFLGVAPVKAIATLSETNFLHKVMISDNGGRVHMWKVSLENEENGGGAASEQEDDAISSPFQNKTEFGEDAKTVCFSPDGSHVLLVFSTNWVIIMTEDLTIVHESPQNADPGWIGGFFLVETGIHGYGQCMFLVWDALGGATMYCLQKTSTETSAAREVCWLPPIITNCKLQCSIKYQQFQDSLLCVSCSDSFLPTPHVGVRLWLLPKRFLTFSELQHSGYIENGVSPKQGNLIMYGQGDLCAHWKKLVSNLPSEVVSRKPAAVEGTHENILPRESTHCSFMTEWVTSSLVLFNKPAIPLALVLGFNIGVIKLITFKTTLQEGDAGIFEEKESDGIVQDLKKHTGPILCLAEHTISTPGSGPKRFLISGGMDCLTCIWDFNNWGQLLMTLHHHVTPVHQILVPPSGTYAPWSHCFITVGEDGCIALVSLETLQVERMFVGHPTQPKQIAWDGIRGYLSCLCSSGSMPSMIGGDVLFMWDMKSGALERILRGAAAHSMYSHFARQLQGISTVNGLFKVQTTSISSLLHGEIDSPWAQSADKSVTSQSSGFNSRKRIENDSLPILSSKHGTDDKSSEILRLNLGESSSNKMVGTLEKISSRLSQALNQGPKAVLPEFKDHDFGSSLESSNRNLFHKQPPIKGSSPIPGVTALQFDLFTLMAPDLGRMGKTEREIEQSKIQTASNHHSSGDKANGHSSRQDVTTSDEALAKSVELELASSLGSAEGCLLRTSLAFLHLWGADVELDKCLQKEWRIVQPLSVGTAAGFAGDRGATTLLLPGWESTFEMWTLSAEFCALRSLTLVAIALRMTTLSRHTSNANSALAAFYTREFAEKFPKVKAPSLELYACFWQDPSEHVRMAARSLFHCAVSRAIPPVLCAKGSLGVSQEDSGQVEHGNICDADSLLRLEQKLAIECTYEKAIWPDSVSSSAEIIDWLESYEGQAWTEVVEGTGQDARAGRIIVGAALAVWYPGLVKPELAPSVAPYLVKLVKAVVDRHSAVAAELLADGMESVWRHLISDEIPHMISDVFLLIECLSGNGAPKPNMVNNPATAMTIRETLTGSLLPCLAMADVASFLQIIHTQISSTSTSSSVHLVGLMTTIRIVRGAPRVVVFHLSQVMSIILQAMNTGKHCHQTAMAAVREMVRVYPMVALHQSSGKLAVGDAAGDVHSLAIHVYDLNSASKIRVLDASGPPGHPALLVNDGAINTGGISALAFSEDGDGVVAFSQHGLMIRWWSLSTIWWEKLSRVNTPLQCNKLVLVPPWSGFSPKSSRSSIMATISNTSEMEQTYEESKCYQHEDTAARANSQNIDLSFRLEWKSGKKILLLHHGQQLGVFQL